MADKKNLHIPLYGIDSFSKKEGKKQFEIEVFDSNRHFEVHYPHRHDFFEILFLTRGSGTHTIDFTDYKITPNSIFFLSPGQIHSIHLSKDIYGYIFLFTAEFFSINKSNKNKLLEYPFFFNTGDKNPPLLLKEKDTVEFLQHLFIKGCTFNTSPKNEDSIHAILDLILSICLQHYPTSSSKSTKKANQLVKKFKLLIEEKYAENLSVKDFANLLSITPNHLNETVKNITGKTATSLINEKLIIEAKKLMLHTNLNTSEIATLLHFSDQSYFSKFFKKQTGESPKAFKSKNP